jgi:hypothetical protein
VDSQAQDIIDDWPLGRIGQGIEAAALLMECVANTDGDYIEIGSAYGGSAVLAAKAMGDRAGTVYCIDPFTGMNALDGIDYTIRAFWDNIFTFGVEQRVVAFYQHNPPFPTAIHYHLFSVGLIDGSHGGVAPFRDFVELDDRVTDYLLFDNAEYKEVENTITRAIMSGNWEEHKSIEYDSTFKDDKVVKIVALHRTTPVEQKSVEDKLLKYTGSNVLLN